MAAVMHLKRRPGNWRERLQLPRLRPRWESDKLVDRPLPSHFGLDLPYHSANMSS